MSDDGAVAALAAQVATMFPPGVSCVLLAVGDGCAPVHPAEMRAIASAVPSRRREFRCGRACAHRAIRALGGADAPILRGPRGEPVWPEGLVGAISHTSLLAGAAVADAGAVRGIGLDIERTNAVFDDRQIALVFTPAEVASLDALHTGGVPAEVVLFGAKECVHKALVPATHAPLDYQEVSVNLDRATGRFVAALQRQRGIRGAAGGPFVGRFLVTEGHVITSLTVTRPRVQRDLTS